MLLIPHPVLHQFNIWISANSSFASSFVLSDTWDSSDHCFLSKYKHAVHLKPFLLKVSSFNSSPRPLGFTGLLARSLQRIQIGEPSPNSSGQTPSKLAASASAGHPWNLHNITSNSHFLDASPSKPSDCFVSEVRPWTQNEATWSSSHSGC